MAHAASSTSMQQQEGTVPWPPGYRFQPTDHELLNDFLKKKINGEPSWLKITEAKIYEDHPSKIFDEATGQELGWDENGEEQGNSLIWWRYFYARLINHGDFSTGKKKRRYVATGGTWIGKYKEEIKVKDDDNGGKMKIIGWKKRFNYKEKDDDNNDADAVKVKWVMHEYSLLDQTNNHDNWVLCCLTKKVKKHEYYYHMDDNNNISDGENDNDDREPKKKKGHENEYPRDENFGVSKRNKNNNNHTVDNNNNNNNISHGYSCYSVIEERERKSRKLRNSNPQLSQCYNTLKLHQFLALAVFQVGDALIKLYHSFISDFETKINLHKLAHFAAIVSRQYAENEAAIGYLEGLIEKIRATKEMRMEEAVLYIKMQIALFKLEQGEQKECMNLLEDGKITLDSMTDIDPSVYASFYWVSSQYHKARQEFAQLYKNALGYLAYTLVESLSESFKLDLAFDLSSSALLGYQELCVCKDALNAQPTLVPNKRKLLEKINILCLMEIIFNWPSQDRTIPLKVISECTRLSIEDVEYLLMKSLSVHLIVGIIDQVDRTVHVSWLLGATECCGFHRSSLCMIGWTLQYTLPCC